MSRYFLDTSAILAWDRHFRDIPPDIVGQLDLGADRDEASAPTAPPAAR